MASQPRITDTNMALETTNYMKHKILEQSYMSMLSQANLVPQTVLQLLQNLGARAP